MEIKVNDYVRTKTGNITKVIKVKDTVIWTDDFMDVHGRYNEGVIEKTDIAKHSPNIIDLIEVGDILRVFDNLSETEEKVNIFDDEMLKAVKEDIKDNNYKILSILTHEQFSSLEYII